MQKQSLCREGKGYFDRMQHSHLHKIIVKTAHQGSPSNFVSFIDVIFIWKDMFKKFGKYGLQCTNNAKALGITWYNKNAYELPKQQWNEGRGEVFKSISCAIKICLNSFGKDCGLGQWLACLPIALITCVHGLVVVNYTSDNWLW